MAARVLHYWQDRDRSKVYGCGAEDESRYRDELVERVCSDFAWVRDVAEAYKHVELTRRLPTRVVTRYDQTAATSRPLADIMRNAIAMWERLLDDMMM
jgi:hypothetical protein